MNVAAPEPIVRVAQLMATFPGTWFLIGGWAVDAWVGSQTRDHLDVDIGLFREDERAVFVHLRGWHMAAHDTPDAAHDDQWDGHALRFPAHVHARKPGWPELDINFNERHGSRWIVNRRPRLTVSVDSAARENAWGLPVLVPKLILWHKGRAQIRPHDQQDFDSLLPRLDEAQREWLNRALAMVDARHPWLREIKAR